MKRTGLTMSSYLVLCATQVAGEFQKMVDAVPYTTAAEKEKANALPKSYAKGDRRVRDKIIVTFLTKARHLGPRQFAIWFVKGGWLPFLALTATGALYFIGESITRYDAHGNLLEPGTHFTDPVTGQTYEYWDTADDGDLILDHRAPLIQDPNGEPGQWIRGPTEEVPEEELVTQTGDLVSAHAESAWTGFTDFLSNFV
jgi:hypothetical protein